MPVATVGATGGSASATDDAVPPVAESGSGARASVTGVFATGSIGGVGSVFGGAMATVGEPIRRSATGRITATAMISAATEVVAARAGREVR